MIAGGDQLGADVQLLHLQRMMLMGSVASGYVHDLNNLLTVIVAEAALAEEALPAGHPCRESLGDILRASSSAGAITRRLLDFVRRQPVRRGPIDLHRLIEDYLPLGARLVGRQVRISAAIDPRLWPVRADPVQIEQLLLNLLINARDAMPDGGAVSITATNVRADPARQGRGGEYVCLTVADSGVGMGPEIAAHLFEPFVSGGESGVGLGLATCHCIVCQLGGTIEVESAPGSGATFRIHLPRAADDPSAALQRMA